MRMCMSFGGSYGAFIARCKRGGYAGGPKRAAFWRQLGFPNLVLARAAKAKKREQRLAVERKREALKRNPFAMLDDLPPYDDPPFKHPVKPRQSKKPRQR